MQFMLYASDSGVAAMMAQEIAAKVNKAERVVAERIREDTSPFVPFRTGSLDQRTRVEGNLVIYPGPYARYLYYGKLMVDPTTGSAYAPKGGTKVLTDRDLVFTTDFHPQAQAFWFEASRAQNMDKWRRIAQRAVNENG